MAVVLLEDDYSPETQAYYFRQDVWSEWNGHRLVATRRDDADLDVMRTYPTYRTAVRSQPPQKGRTLVHARVALLTDHAQPFALEAPAVFAPSTNPNPERFTRAYRFESLALTLPYRQLRDRSVGDPAWSDELREYYTQAPEDPRFRDLANEIIEQLPPGLRQDPFTKALAVKLYLDRQLTYSTRERHAQAADPTADMLFGNKIGYCVHFAHAAVLLWRTLGIPARVGTGYHSPEDNRRGSIIVLRSNDGHAWPEIYFEGVGWVVLDIAAERNLDPPGDPVDEDLQEMLGEMARENPPEPLEPEPEQPMFQNLGRTMAGALIVLIAAALILLYLVKLWRGLLPLVEGPRQIARVGYRAALDRLSEVGISREFGETREDFARRVEPIAPGFARMTAWNVAARFGQPSDDLSCRQEFSVDNWREALRDHRVQLASKVKLWRRVLGLLNPISIFFSR
jgi:transglutaminase-like putative cysteine protease